MARTGYDSVDARSVPTNGDIYPGYVNGAWPTRNALKARFPHALVPGITVNDQTLDAEIIDCESGDATPAEAALWARAKVKRDKHATIYCSESAYLQVVHACRNVGLKPGRNVFFWIAWYADSGSDAIPQAPGVIGRQYASPDGVGGSKVHDGNYDISSFVKYWPGVDPTRAQRVKKVVLHSHGWWSWFWRKKSKS